MAVGFFGAEIDGPLVLIRAIHFAASAVTAGTLAFGALVAEPALRPLPAARAMFRSRTAGLALAGLAITAATGLIWLLALTMSITGQTAAEALRSGSLTVVLGETRFGLALAIRAALSILLAACLILDSFALSRWLALLAASALLGMIAWTGHAGSTPGELGRLHLFADVVHLLAASAWLGGLIGLSVLFGYGRHRPAGEWGPLQLDAVRRFSVLGIVSVAALIVSGSVNAWILVGSLHALLATDYGRVLLVKIAALTVMIAFAADNRFRLTPSLAAAAKKAETDHRALSAMRRNMQIELALGLSIFGLVGVLGTLHPAIHLMN